MQITIAKQQLFSKLEINFYFNQYRRFKTLLGSNSIEVIINI